MNQKLRHLDSPPASTIKKMCDLESDPELSLGLSQVEDLNQVLLGVCGRSLWCECTTS